MEKAWKITWSELVIDLRQTPIQVLLNITMSFSLILGLLCSLVSISFWMWAKILFLPLLSLEASSISELLLFLPDYRVDKIPSNVVRWLEHLKDISKVVEVVI